MNIGEFVSETLSQIIDGIRSAQESEMGENEKAEGGSRIGKINPPHSAGDQTIVKRGQLISTFGEPIQDVEFDIAVTVEESTGAKAGLRVMGIGAGGELSAKESTVSRIKFSVPIELPRKNPAQ